MPDSIYCPIRKAWIAALPEEIVRQRLLALMVDQLGYPASHIVVEKGLKQMPHLALTQQKIPSRRADILCYAPGIHPQHALYPLLLIECKAVPLTNKVLNQVAGYNHFLQSYFVAVANQDEIRTGWYDRQQKQYCFVPNLPDYQQLINKLKKF